MAKFWHPSNITTSGGGGNPTIGLPVIGGDPNDVLFVDASGNLAQDDGFQYDPVAETFVAGFTVDSSVGLVVAPLQGAYALGDFNSIYNKTLFQIDDSDYLTDFYGLAYGMPDVASNVTFPIGTPGYSGSGLNDMQWSGYFNDFTQLNDTFTVNISALADPTSVTIGYTSTGTYSIGDTISVISGTGTGSTGIITAFPTPGSVMTLGSISLVGSGFSENGDVVTNGAPLSDGVITSGANPLTSDQFTWSDSNGNSGSGDTAAGTVSLANGISIVFGDSTGHQLDDAWVWDFTLTQGGRLQEFDGQHATWLTGDLDNVIKGQYYGIVNPDGDPTNWAFQVGENAGRALYLNPVDAPTAGNYSIGDIDDTNQGTFLRIDDTVHNRSFTFLTNYGGTSDTPLFLVAAGSTVFGTGAVIMGDWQGAVNDTYGYVSDSRQQIDFHSTLIGAGVDSYYDNGNVALPTLSASVNGSFNSVLDSNTGDQGIGGVGDLTGFGGTTAGSFMAHIAASGAFSEQLIDDLGAGPGVYSTANDGAGNTMDAFLTVPEWGVIGSNGTGINVNDSTQLIIFNNNYQFPFADGTPSQILQTDGAGTLSWVTGSGGGSPGGTNGQVQLNVSGVFAGQTTTNHMQWNFNDSTRVASYLDSAGTYLSIDADTGLYTMGDLSGAGHSNKIVLNDGSVQDFRYETGSAKYLFLSHTLNLFQMGDIDGSHNSSFLEIDDGAKLLEFSSGAHNYLKLDVTNKIYEMGDLSAVGNSTQFIVDDQNQRIAMDANLLVQLSAQTIKRTGGIQDSTVTIVPFNIGTASITLNQYDFEFSGSTGTPHMNLPTGMTAPIGTIFMFSDLDCIAAANNITIDAGTSNFIVGSSSAQTFVMNQNGQSITLKKVTAIQWKIQ